MKRYFSFSNILLLLTVAVGSFLRFYNPLWDSGLFLHPDERLFVNASSLFLPTSWQQFFSTSSPLNPHMFYYGSFLLYLYKLLSLVSPFSFLMTSRMVSALFSALTISIIYVIGKELFSKKVGLLSSVVFAFAAGSIQYAHFNTTESSLIFFIALITYLDILCVKKKKPQLLLLTLMLVGVATATKITGFLYIVSPLLASFLLLREKIQWKKVCLWMACGILLGAIALIVFAPYQLIDMQTFLTQQSYMQAVTYGVFKPPFVIIYQNTIPFLYQMLQVFPFIFGFISFPVALVGLLLLFYLTAKEWRKHLIFAFLFVFPLLYFCWSATWYAKFARYYLLLVPFLSIWAGYALSKARWYVLILLLAFIMCNGLLMLRIYTTENTRVVASQWIDTHIPPNASIATEHWDDALPLMLPNQSPISFSMVTLTVYDEETAEKVHTLSSKVASSDYIILSSRRVYVSIERNVPLYPSTSHFYDLLFSGKLGFQKVYEKTNYPFFFSDNFADETFQSYDHPPVIIFKNVKHLSSSQILALIRE